MNIGTYPETGSAELDLSGQVRALWRAKWIILGVAAAGGLAAAVAALVVPKRYEASVLVLPLADATSRSQLGGLGGLASQFAGLASLAGISSLGDSGKKAESVAVLQSESLTETYIRDNDLLPVLFRSRWDASSRKWKTQDPDKVPTLWKANEYFKKNVREVSTNTKTGLVTLTISWRDPHEAAKWANDLVRLTNDYLRNRAIQESERNVAFLNAEAAKTTVVEVRQAIYPVLQSEINREMLARGSEEYALKVIDPAVAPEKAASPKLTLWTFMGALCGFLLSAGVAVFRMGSGSDQA